jgi:hypothetical protein
MHFQNPTLPFSFLLLSIEDLSSITFLLIPPMISWVIEDVNPVDLCFCRIIAPFVRRHDQTTPMYHISSLFIHTLNHISYHCIVLYCPHFGPILGEFRGTEKNDLTTRRDLVLLLTRYRHRYTIVGLSLSLVLSLSQ